MDDLLASAYVNTAIDLVSSDGLEDEAEASFRHAIDLDPTGRNLGAYAWFLEIFRRDADRAESYYRKAIEAQPKCAQALVFYASFLDAVRHDPDAAEPYHLQAIELAPEGVERAAHISTYADFLEFARHDYDKAEEYCKMAIEADPADGDYLESYARFLRLRGRDLDTAESFYKRAIEADSPGEEHFAGYAHFLAACRNDPVAAERQFRAAEKRCHELIKADDSPRTRSVLLAQAVLAQGRTKDGLGLLSDADKSGLRPDLQIVVLFLRYAHETRPSRRAVGLSALKVLLSSDVRSRGADLDGNTVQARLAGHPDPDFIEKLAGVIANGDDIKDLDGFAAWRSA
jgi:tetratricopeptide (TPR) repeat protein